MKVNELAQRAGVTAHAVRYYVKAGLLKPTRNLSNGYKQFTNGDVGRVRFVGRAQQFGFTLAEIAEIIRTSGRRQSPCPLVRQIIERRFVDKCAELDELVALRERMAAAIDRWKRLPDAIPTGDDICHLIESLDR